MDIYVKQSLQRPAMKKQITGYHFTDDKLRDGEPIPKIGAVAATRW